MLSMKEVHYYNDLVTKGIFNPINCPFNEESVGNHILLPFLDEEEVWFKCLTCDSSFTPGLNTIDIIKKSIQYHLTKNNI
jgi:hypothetical protein